MIVTPHDTGHRLLTDTLQGKPSLGCAAPCKIWYALSPFTVFGPFGDFSLSHSSYAL